MTRLQKTKKTIRKVWEDEEGGRRVAMSLYIWCLLIIVGYPASEIPNAHSRTGALSIWLLAVSGLLVSPTILKLGVLERSERTLGKWHLSFVKWCDRVAIRILPVLRKLVAFVGALSTFLFVGSILGDRILDRVTSGEHAWCVTVFYFGFFGLVLTLLGGLAIGLLNIRTDEKAKLEYLSLNDLIVVVARSGVARFVAFCFFLVGTGLAFLIAYRAPT